MEKENHENKVIQFNALSEMRDAVVFETAWTYHTMEASKKKRDKFIEEVKIIWNRSLGRVGRGANLMDLGFDEGDVKKVLVEVWGNKSINVLEISRPATSTVEEQNHDSIL